MLYRRGCAAEGTKWLTIQNPCDELGNLGLAFSDTVSRLERFFEQLRGFTADASYELRTSLTAIRTVGEVALQNSGDVDYYRDIMGCMLEEANQVTGLVDRLLTTCEPSRTRREGLSTVLSD